MLIQNVSNMVQSPQPVRLPSNGAPKVAEAVVQAVSQQPSPQQLNNAVAAINKAMQQSNRSLEFSVDSNTKKPIVKIVDTTTGDVIRQIPSEEILAIAQSIDEFMQFQQGLLIRQKG